LDLMEFEPVAAELVERRSASWRTPRVFGLGIDSSITGH